MALRILRGDITTVQVDAIVNAANSGLLGGGGVDGAIHAAGGPSILKECRALRQSTLRRGLPPGQAIGTGAGNLPAKWVIHAVGPVYSSIEDRSGLLVSAYQESVRVARELGAHSIAFPAISAGAYGWPLGDAARIAVETLTRVGADLDITLVAFSGEAQAAFEGHLVQD